MTPSFGMLTTYPPTQCGLATFVELLSDGAGLLVPQGDAPAIGRALRRLLTEPGLADTTAAAARAIAPTLLWPAVAAQYIGAGHALAMKRRESVA
jgi:glycosyltransferase involved in cell wall biosynthesis